MSLASIPMRMADAVALKLAIGMGAKRPLPKAKLLDLAIKDAELEAFVNPLEIHNLVVAGLSGRVVSNLQAVLEVNQEEIAHLLEITPKTVRAREAEAHLPCAESERLWRFMHTWTVASIVFEDPDYANEWLHEPCAAIGGQVPFNLLASATGEKVVLDELSKIEHGLPV